MIITKPCTFGVPIRPKYYRKKKWKEKGIREGWWVTEEKIHEVINEEE